MGGRSENKCNIRLATKGNTAVPVFNQPCEVPVDG